MPVGPASPQLPFPSHYQRFVVSTFAFVDTPSMAVLEGEVSCGGVGPRAPRVGVPSLCGTRSNVCHPCSQVYILCSASVCHLAQPEPCRPSCQLAVPSRKLGLVWGGS